MKQGVGCLLFSMMTMVGWAEDKKLQQYSDELVKEAEEDNPSPPLEIFRDRSAVSGGAQLGQNASFAFAATELGRYKHKIFLAIGSRWNTKVQQAISKTGVGRVVVRFRVNPDGSISDIVIKVGNPNSALGVMSGDAVQQSSRLVGPFPSELLAERPHGFYWSLAFTIK